MKKRGNADPFEGHDIMMYIEREMDGIDDDELTKGRIRSIFVRLKYRQSSPNQLAEYYDLPVQVIKGIGSGQLFGSITRDLRGE